MTRGLGATARSQVRLSGPRGQNSRSTVARQAQRARGSTVVTRILWLTELIGPFPSQVQDVLIAILDKLTGGLRSVGLCRALVRLFGQDTQGDATLLAVKTTSALLKSSSFNVQPDVLAT